MQVARERKRSAEHDQRHRDDQPQSVQVELQELRRRQAGGDQRQRGAIPGQERAFIGEREPRIGSLPVCSSRRSRRAINLGHTLAVSEALLGQIYLVTIVAAIVSRVVPRGAKTQ